MHTLVAYCDIYISVFELTHDLLVGYGLIQPMQSVMVADQFDDDGDEETNKQRASSFSWFVRQQYLRIIELTYTGCVKDWCLTLFYPFYRFYMSENIGNFIGESVNPELRATVGPVWAMLSITGQNYLFSSEVIQLSLHRAP